MIPFIVAMGAAVFDGHAGIASVDYLRNNLYQILEDKMSSISLELECSLEERDEGLCCPLELHTVLTDCYRHADQQLLAWLEKLTSDESYSGCTATTALVRSDRIIVANVGDSRAVLSRSGTALDLSTEHRVYGRGDAIASEVERVESVGGWVEDGRVCGILAVSRAFGDSDFKSSGLKRMLSKGVEDGFWTEEFASTAEFTGDPVISEPDVFELATSEDADEFLIVATDGLWDVISSQEVIELARNQFRKGKAPPEVAERLASIAVRRHTADNVAVVVIDLLGEQKWDSLGKQEGGKLFGLF